MADQPYPTGARAMRSLLMVSIESGYGGAQRSTEIIAERLQQDVAITAFASSPKHIAVLQRILSPPSRVIALRYHGGALDWIVSVAKIAAYVAAFRPDIILTNTYLSATMVAALARVMPGLSRRTFIFVRDFSWKNLDRIFNRLAHARVLIPGPALLDRADYLKGHLAPVGPMQWSIVACPVVLRPPANEVDAAQTRAANGYVLHLATVDLWKGHYHLIRAAALLRDRGLPMRFISRGIVNDRRLWVALYQLISRWRLESFFHLWDAVEDPSELLAGCTCVVVASVSHFGGPEAFGRTIIEAWAHGKPVVAFDAGGARHVIEHQQDGLLVPEGDIQALADALQSLRQDPQLGPRLGARGLAKVRRLFTAEAVVGELKSILKIESWSEGTREGVHLGTE